MFIDIICYKYLILYVFKYNLVEKNEIILK